MCYNPIDVVNPTKYVSLAYRDRYIMQVPCGKCAACMAQKSAEWTYRLYHHALDTFKDGFTLFDTLTYDDVHLPHISDYISVSPELDFPCFSSRDLRLFVADLRQRCKRKFNSNFSYFIASEYGTSERHLHRPHYHALFFVHGDIKPIQFSQLVSETWNRGRTDGFPWKSASYVLDNTFSEMNAHALRSIKYVCKYIQKDTTFQRCIDSRLNAIMKDISDRFEKIHGLTGWSDSSHYWRVREAISRRISQFHRQSSFLGASVLGDIDLNDLFHSGSLSMPDNDKVVRQIPLPTYFKRKLFYELVEIDGSKVWQPTELGKEYLQYRENARYKMLVDKLHSLGEQLRLSFNVSKVADYVLSWRGRFKNAAHESFSVIERLRKFSLFNYVNRYDKESLGRVGLSYQWYGNSVQGYIRCKPLMLPLGKFIKDHVIFDNDIESLLSKMFSYLSDLSKGRQKVFEEKQRLANIVHHYFVPV